MTQLSEFQLDAMRELSNMAINRAAGQLSELTGQPVQLRVPQIQFMTLLELERFLAEEYQATAPCINQNFYGSFAGRSLLLYPHSSANDLVSLLLNTEKDIEALSALESSALIEIGNILINSFMGFVCEILELTIDFTVPQMHILSQESVRSIIHETDDTGKKEEKDSVALMIDNEMSIEGTQITGHIIVFIDDQTAQRLVAQMEKTWLS